MGILSNIFNQKKGTKLLEIKELCATNKDLNFLVQPINLLLHKSEVYSSDFDDILSELDKLLMEKNRLLQNSTNTDIFKLQKQCIKLCKSKSLYSDITFENFDQHLWISTIKTELEITEKLCEILPDFRTKMGNVFWEFSNQKDDLLALEDEILAFKNYEKTLSTEIINYTNAVNQTKAKNRLSVDWNGKKQPLMNLGQTLKIKRQQFENDSEKINQKIADFCDECLELHGFLTSNCSDILAKLQIITPNKQDLQSEISNISSVKNQVLQFITL